MIISVFYPEPFVVMVGGSSEYEGRVEIYQKGRWGSLCKPLSHVEASYICRHLGYLGGIATGPGHFGEGSGVFWTMNFTCLLSRQCSIAKPVIDESHCDHSNDYGVICGKFNAYRALRNRNVLFHYVK